MSEQVKQLFSKISSTYDQVNHVLSFNIDKKWRQKTIDQIRKSKNDSLKALDLCAGTLDLSVKFLEEFPKAHVWAVDFSYNMLHQGLKKLSPDLKKRLHVVCADALKLPFKKQTFDVVFCGYGFRNLDNQNSGLLEINRVLKQTGELLILDFFKPQKYLTRLFHSTYGNILLPLVGGMISGEKQAYRYLHQSIVDFYTLKECKEMIEKCGFKDIISKDFLIGISSLVQGIKFQSVNSN